jgi:hypothetical protein
MHTHHHHHHHHQVVRLMSAPRYSKDRKGEAAKRKEDAVDANRFVPDNMAALQCCSGCKRNCGKALSDIPDAIRNLHAEVYVPASLSH